jgi:predicted HTH domain antitoxin
MQDLGLQEVSKPISETAVSVGELAELTGFPVEYIQRELNLDAEAGEEMTIDELRKKVLTYLDSTF